MGYSALGHRLPRMIAAQAAVMLGLSAHGYELSEAAILAVAFRLANLVPSAMVVVLMVLLDEVNLRTLIRRARGGTDAL